MHSVSEPKGVDRYNPALWTISSIANFLEKIQLLTPEKHL